MCKEDKIKKLLSDFVIYTKYSGYKEDEKRRKTWEEAVRSVEDMHINKYPQLKEDINKAFSYVYDKKVFPSMRSIQFGGLPIELAPNRIFNCSYAPIDHPFAFAEAMFLLLGGTGFGYSVRNRFISKLPNIKNPDGSRRFMIGDSIEGWADSIRQLTYAYFYGKTLPIFDYRDIRPQGSPIRKTGGKAPGPDKLIECHININNIFNQAIGRKLTSLEVHDIMCHIADCVLAGGVRAAAMISFFDIDDYTMMTCKSLIYVKEAFVVNDSLTASVISFKLDDEKNKINKISQNLYKVPNNDGWYKIRVLKVNGGDYDIKEIIEKNEIPWYYLQPQRGRSNNSVVLRRGDVSKDEFKTIWKIIEKNKTGEPGISWTSDDDMGSNPCHEIALNPHQFCNLTSVNVSDIETQEELNNRVIAASFIGTLQASFTDYHYLRKEWKEMSERDALLGVSMTGIASSKINQLNQLNKKEAAVIARKTNEKTAKLIGINKAARVTCIKPEGSSTLVAGALGSGIHPVYGKYIIRNTRIKKTDPIYKYLIENNYPFIEDEFTKEDINAVVGIPLKANEGSITREESAIDFLTRIADFSQEWILTGHRRGVNTHNVSATVYIRDNEWNEVFEWLWNNHNKYNGVSVLPFNGANYKQAPFIEISEKEYNEMVDKIDETKIDLTKINDDGFQIENHASNTLACSGGACEI